MDIMYMDIGARPANPTPGQARFNTATNYTEVWDGANWMPITAGEVTTLSLADIVQDAEDQIAVIIEEEYRDNAAIMDAFDQWEEANKRFRVILQLAGKQ